MNIYVEDALCNFMIVTAIAAGLLLHSPTAQLGQRGNRFPRRSDDVATQRGGDGLEKVSITVGGVQRQFLVHFSNVKASPSPVVFAFHGHGGNMNNSAKKFNMHTLWQEATTVYMEGLPCVGITDPKGEKNGWQKEPGDLDDRDLKFFDAVNTWIHDKVRVDDRAIFCAGHSNGGAFTYLLWSTHPNLFQAIAPIAAGGKCCSGKVPVSMLSVTGSQDKIVLPFVQKRSVEYVKRVNECSPVGKEIFAGATRWDSKSGHPVIHYVFDGGHSVPDNVPPMIIRFFKESLAR
jgi:polyhydroxybutyrate depolymerase